MDKEKPKNGLYIERYDNDQLKFEQNYKDGNLHGRFISWYKNGLKKSEGNYNSKAYMPDGTRIKGYMLDGSFQPKSVLDGPFNEWHENGNLKKSGLYLNGMKHYTWTEWNDKGEEIKSEWNHVF